MLLLGFILLIPAYHFALDASIQYATFKGPQQNYVEVYMHFVAKTLHFIPVEERRLQAGVDVVILFKKNDQIVKYDKYRLNSPSDTLARNFIDQRRFALENGQYSLEVSIQDIHDSENAKTYTTELNMQYEDAALTQSDIQLLTSYHEDNVESPFTKNGFYLESLPFNYCEKNMSSLPFYVEIYNADRILKEDFMVSYSIEKIDGKGIAQPVMKGYKRRPPQAFTALLLQMDVSKLESGNYQLAVEVRNRAQELISRKTVPFQRSNPYLNITRDELSQELLREEFVNHLNKEELRYSLKAISMKIPSADGELLSSVISNGDLNAQRRFLFSYWVTESPNHPEAAYQKYMEIAKAVDRMYANGFGYGFESDRGNIYMKYGQPDDMISVEDDPTAPPYEIWTYNDFKATNQTNVKFIFYNPTLINNGHRLLHSTARGEVNNPRWKVELYKNAPNDINGNSIDATEVKDNWNRNASRLFNDQ